MHQKFEISSSDKWIIPNNEVDHSGMWENQESNEVHVGESRLDIKEVKAIVEGLSYQIASLMAAKSIKLHAYNQFNQIHTQIKPMQLMWWKNSQTTTLTLIFIILDGETISTFHGLTDSNRMEQELQIYWH